MKRTLDLSQALKTFDGKTMKVNDDAKERDFLLKDVLLAYLAQAHAMGLSAMEEGTAYELGCKMGIENGEIALETHQYDLLKRICDSGKVRQGQNEQALFSLVVSQQAKRMVDAAPVD